MHWYHWIKQAACRYCTKLPEPPLSLINLGILTLETSYYERADPASRASFVYRLIRRQMYACNRKNERQNTKNAITRPKESTLNFRPKAHRPYNPFPPTPPVDIDPSWSDHSASARKVRHILHIDSDSMLIQRLVDQDFLYLVCFLLCLLRRAADGDAEGLCPYSELSSLLDDSLVDRLWRPVDVNDILEGWKLVEEVRYRKTAYLLQVDLSISTHPALSNQVHDPLLALLLRQI